MTCDEETSLSTDQEEADTKVFLCAKHAQLENYSSVLIHTVDSDIPIYALYFENQLRLKILV